MSIEPGDVDFGRSHNWPKLPRDMATITGQRRVRAGYGRCQQSRGNCFATTFIATHCTKAVEMMTPDPKYFANLGHKLAQHQ